MGMIGRRRRRNADAATGSTSFGVREAESTGTAPSASDLTGPPVLEARGLVKRYGDHAAVDGIDLDIREGEVFALLGPPRRGHTGLAVPDRARAADLEDAPAASRGGGQPSSKTIGV